MDWSPGQERALLEIDRWLKNRETTRFALGGYAGTGKTTLARHIAESLGGEVKFAAFTGKAASVLREKGCPGATTIHKLIYQPKGNVGQEQVEELQRLIEQEAEKQQPDQQKLSTWQRELNKATEESSAVFERKSDCEIEDADLVIVDESSMVDARMGKDLESYGVPVLYLGDPGQLPPVKGKAHLTSNDYDFVLEEIHRQAADSPIIWLANEIRQGGSVKFGEFGDGLVRIKRKSEWDMEVALNAGQVITGSNQSRHRLTRAMRKFIGFTDKYPLADDKLICRRNDHDKGYLNGVTCRAARDSFKKGNLLHLEVDYDGTKGQIICDPGLFQENYEQRTIFLRADGVQAFDYGYCITGHKSQGSQWRHVVIADDRMRVNDRLQRRRWLYTVVTRAEEELTYYV